MWLRRVVALTRRHKRLEFAWEWDLLLSSVQPRVVLQRRMGIYLKFERDEQIRDLLVRCRRKGPRIGGASSLHQ